MAGKICNADRLVHRVSVFVTEICEKTYGFLTPDNITELRAFRNEVEDSYPAHKSSESESETELDTPIKEFTPPT